MPSHSPELQLSRNSIRLLINEPIANRSFHNIDELELVLFQRCLVLLLLKGSLVFTGGQKPQLYHYGAAGIDIRVDRP